jgi:hypothetical protein
MSHLFASERVDAGELQQLLVLLKDAGVRASGMWAAAVACSQSLESHANKHTCKQNIFKSEIPGNCLQPRKKLAIYLKSEM